MKFMLLLSCLTLASCHPLTKSEKEDCSSKAMSRLIGNIEGCDVYQVEIADTSGTLCVIHYLYMTKCPNTSLQWKSGKHDKTNLGQ